MRRQRLHVSTVRGPWFSFGVHVDLAGPFVDLHVLWWIISFGRLRHVRAD